MLEADRCFRIVVLSEVLARPEYSTTPEPLLEGVRIDRGTLDDVMRHLGVTLSLDVPDPFASSRVLELSSLRLDGLRAFKPTSLVDWVPELRALRAAYGVLSDFEQRRRTLPDVVEQLERALSAHDWAAHITSLLSNPAEPVASSPALATSPVAQSSDLPPRVAPSPLDTLFDSVELPGDEARPAPQERDESAVDRLLSTVVRGASKPEALRQEVARARAAVEQAFSALLGSLLQHPEFVRLECAWRGLRLLVEHNGARSGAEIDVVPTRPTTVLAALERLALRGGSERDRSAIDLLVVDYAANESARDRALLSSWGQQAEQLRAPLLTGAHPSLIGFTSLEELAKTRKGLTNSQENWAVSLRALSGGEGSRWLMLMLNGMLVRAPYTAESSKLGELRFAESLDEPAIFAPAPFAAAILALHSFTAHGHPFDLYGAHGGPSVIADLMVHEVGEGSARVAIAVQAPLDAEIQTELGRLGIAALAAVRNRDRAVVAKMPMLWRSPGPVDADAQLTLIDQLFVGRMARAIEQLGAAIPEHADERAIKEVAALTLAELLTDGAPPGPEIAIEVANRPRRLIINLRPRRYRGVNLEELTFEAALEKNR